MYKHTQRDAYTWTHTLTVTKVEFSVCCVNWTLTIIKSEPPCRSKEIPLALCWISVLKCWPLFQEVYVPLHIETVSLRVSMSLAAGGCDSVCLWTTSKYAYGGFSTLQFPEYPLLLYKVALPGAMWCSPITLWRAKLQEASQRCQTWDSLGLVNSKLFLVSDPGV